MSLLLTLVLLSRDGVPVAASRLACVVRTASVVRVTRVPRVMAAALFFVACFLLIVFVDSDARVVGDQGLDFARSARGFLSRKGLLFVSMHGSCGDDTTATIIIVVQ